MLKEDAANIPSNTNCFSPFIIYVLIDNSPLSNWINFDMENRRNFQTP